MSGFSHIARNHLAMLLGMVKVYDNDMDDYFWCVSTKFDGVWSTIQHYAVNGGHDDLDLPQWLPEQHFDQCEPLLTLKHDKTNRFIWKIVPGASGGYTFKVKDIKTMREGVGAARELPLAICRGIVEVTINRY